MNVKSDNSQYFAQTIIHSSFPDDPKPICVGGIVFYMESL